MAIVAVPDVEAAWHPARLQQARHMAVLAEAVIVPPARKEIGVVSISIQLPRWAKVRDVMWRDVEVNILVVIAVQEIG